MELWGRTCSWCTRGSNWEAGETLAPGRKVRPLDCGDLTRRPGDLAWPRYFPQGESRSYQIGSAVRVNYGFANRSSRPRVDRFPRDGGRSGLLRFRWKYGFSCTPRSVLY